MRLRARWGIAPLLAAPAGAWALGLGQLEVQSVLNQPFRAEIALSATADELQGLKVGLADADAFARQGLDRPAFLSRLEFRIVTGRDGRSAPLEGLPAAGMSADQRGALLRLIRHYTGLANDEDGAARTAEIEQRLDETYFAWRGPTAPGSPIYFRVTGPAIVIEYAAQGPGAGGGARTPNHIHGIYRDPTNDYGAKYLRLPRYLVRHVLDARPQAS